MIRVLTPHATSPDETWETWEADRGWQKAKQWRKKRLAHRKMMLEEAVKGNISDRLDQWAQHCPKKQAEGGFKSKGGKNSMETWSGEREKKKDKSKFTNRQMYFKFLLNMLSVMCESLEPNAVSLHYRCSTLRSDWPTGMLGFWCIGVTVLVLSGRRERLSLSCKQAEMMQSCTAVRKCALIQLLFLLCVTQWKQQRRKRSTKERKQRRGDKMTEMTAGKVGRKGQDEGLWQGEEERKCKKNKKETEWIWEQSN